MKIIKESKIEERFPNESTLDDHYKRHVKKDGYSVNRWGEKEPEFTPKKFPTKTVDRMLKSNPTMYEYEKVVKNIGKFIA